MQGLFSDVPLIGVLSIINDLGHSGILDVEADIPFFLHFVKGEIVNGGILDWEGIDAIRCCPLIPQSGSFNFKRQDMTGTPLMPFDTFSTEWARVNDEWQRFLKVIGSPSTQFMGNLSPIFNQYLGASVRAATAFTPGEHLADVAGKVAAGVRSKQLEATGRYAWYNYVLPKHEPYTNLSHYCDGYTSLGQIIENGMDIADVRTDLIYEIRLGLRFEGCGWVLRDLTWESQYSDD